jgi:hypothetical protein
MAFSVGLYFDVKGPERVYGYAQSHIAQNTTSLEYFIYLDLLFDFVIIY